MIYKPYSYLDPITRYTPAHFYAHVREFDLESDETTEGGWPVNNRRVRFALGQLETIYWPRQRYRDRIPPEELSRLDVLAKKNRLHHYQRIRSSDEAIRYLSRQISYVPRLAREQTKWVISNLVFDILGVSPADHLRFAQKALLDLERHSFVPPSALLKEHVDMACWIVDELGEQSIWLDRFSNRILAPRIIPNMAFRASLEITPQWEDPPGGKIEVDNGEVIGVHDIAIIGITEDNTHILVLNTWGENWGNGGYGYVSREYFDKHLIEAWDFGFDDAKPSFVSGSGMQTIGWTAFDFAGGRIHGREIYDFDRDDKIAWMFVIERDGLLDVEELFVRSAHRFQGYGARLAACAVSLSKELGLPLRVFISHADAWIGNMGGVRAILKSLSLDLVPSSVKWAAYEAISGAPSTAPVPPAIIPPRSMHLFKKRAAKSNQTKTVATPTEYACYSRMDRFVLVGAIARITVSINVVALFVGDKVAMAKGTLGVDPNKKIVVHVIAKKHFETAGEDRHEFPPPAMNEVFEMLFDVKATDLGTGEVWVVFLQGPVPLLTLRLEATVVEAGIEAAGISVQSGITTQPAIPTEPLHQLMIFERQQGGRYSFQYVFQSPELGILEQHESKSLATSKLDYVGRIYNHIEGFRSDTGDDEDEFESMLRSYGGELFDELFPVNLQESLWKSRNAFDSIMVVSDEPFIPWELVHLKEPGQPLGAEYLFLCQFGLVRWMHKGWPQESIRIRKGKARYVIPQYDDPNMYLEGTEQEADYLEKTFEATAVKPTLGSVIQLLSTPGSFDLLHFACHGNAGLDDISSASLSLEGRQIIDGDGNLDGYRPSLLTTSIVNQNARLKGNDGNSPMVFVNACQAGRLGYRFTAIGGFAEAFIHRGAGSFVGALWEVGDTSARVFFESFFNSLVDGKSLSEASVKAREETRVAGDATWIAYVVYGHPHAKLKIVE